MWQKVLLPTTNPLGPSVNNLTGTMERHTQDTLSLHNTSLRFWYKTQSVPIVHRFKKHIVLMVFVFFTSYDHSNAAPLNK